ncbi:MAG: TonB-dependent receptor [Gammaproteobacteria bacterium]|nr:TonB-dependent receptor [Gammaproteobacteria bacterium]
MRVAYPTRLAAALGVAAALSSPLSSHAQTPETTAPVVVTATRIATSPQRIGSAVTVIDREAIEASGKTQVQELLRRVPGLTVINRGGAGGRTDVSIRGADEDQTLVLIDGVPMNDPASTGNRFDFSGFSTSGIERIEVLRGPQSALYGSNAMGGVINIITRKGEGAPSGYAALEFGSYETNIQRAGFSVGEESWDLALDASREATEGFSRVKGGAEDDSARSSSFTGRGGYAPLDNLRFEAIGRVEDIDAELDPSNTLDGFADKDETIYTARVGAELDLLDGRWRQQLDFYGSVTDRRFRDPSMTSDFDGQRIGVEYVNDFFVTDNQTITVGIDLREDSGRADESSGGTSSTRYDESEYTHSLFALYQISADDRVFLTGGLRADDYEDFGTEVTYRFTGAILSPSSGTTFRGSIGTGAKAPTIQQRFDDTFLFGFLPVMGNPDLGVETSTGWDLGVEQSFAGDRASINVTLFQNRFDDLIEFDAGSGTFVQVDSAETRGVEVALEVRPIDELRITGTYTYLYSEDESDGSELPRRPKNSGSLVADLQMTSRASMQASMILVGKRYNLSGEREPLDAYARFDLAARYAVWRSVELIARIENLFNTDYEEVADLATPGRSFFAGVRAEF